ncbi:MAG: hypothetical protein QW171_03090 [Candidatus Bilamarchaeaceae archaeon]
MFIYFTVQLLVEIEIQGFIKSKLSVAMDATGFKPTNKGDWRVINHENGEVKRDGYVKLMAGIDLETLSILTGFIGDAQTSDITLFRPAFEELKDKAERFFGDGSFDAFLRSGVIRYGLRDLAMARDGSLKLYSPSSSVCLEKLSEAKKKKT